MAAREVTPPPATGSALGRPADPQARKRSSARLDQGTEGEDDSAAGRNRRRHERLPTYGLSIEIEGQRYALQDLSIGGFRVSPYDGQLSVNREFDFMMRLVVDGNVTPFQARGRVLRTEGKGLVAVYATHEPNFYRKLSRFIERERVIRLSYGADTSATPPKPAFLNESA